MVDSLKLELDTDFVYLHSNNKNHESPIRANVKVLVRLHASGGPIGWVCVVTGSITQSSGHQPPLSQARNMYTCPGVGVALVSWFLNHSSHHTYTHACIQIHPNTYAYSCIHKVYCLDCG